MDNPLVGRDGLPDWRRIEPGHVAPAVRAGLAQAERGLAAVERGTDGSYAGVLGALDDAGDALGFAWRAVGHLMAVRNTPELRAAHAAVQADVVAFFTRVGQSAPVYRALRGLRDDGARWAALTPPRQRAVALAIRNAELSGVALDDAGRDRFAAIEQELADLGTRFQNHLIDATKAFALTLERPEEVAGLPPTARAAAAQAARAAGAAEATAESGPWRITLDGPSLQAFLEHARRDDLRERLYRAHIVRAAAAPNDNGPLLRRMLALRGEQAHLLGFASYAEQSLAAKMAPGLGAVDALLARLRAAALPRAQAELTELAAYAARITGAPAMELRHWDVPFWAERLREERFAVTDEELRPYFSLPRALDGLFGLAQQLFGVRIEAADGAVPVWHDDVRYFIIRDADGAERAAFYLDPYARPADKRGGAWMDAARHRKRLADGRVRTPVAHLVCNQAPPVGGRPSLMSLREVETLFHEAGHGLQHLLTTVDEPDVAGINGVEWDAVELPSQFLEQWVRAPGVLEGLARHVDDGAPLPPALVERIRAARHYRAGSMTLRQVFFATVDLALHRGPVGDPDALYRTAAAENTVLPPLPEDRMLCGFSHIFSGGYAAGYYSYKWAEVLSADAFAAFEEAGLDDVAARARLGGRFRDTVLARGGGEHPADVFRAFRGRDPSPEALLRQTGLA
jgi:oligopeptidase A